MTTKVWMLIAMAIVLGGLSLYLNRDWFAKNRIQIYDRSRPARAVLRRGRADDSAIDPIVFGFDRKLKLTALKVIPICAIETNKYPLPVWSLVSDSNSLPIKAFTYGMRIPGMRSAVEGVRPVALEPGVQYRLFVEVGAIKEQHDFVPVARSE
ncbi:MAG TPA: hypothetical protein VL361_18230 [Candidatus Limnocylindrales bacterium]|nr:hypothetical protein [Candidatus Limnocylindrales bacterium]